MSAAPAAAVATRDPAVRVFTATLDRVLRNQHLRARLLAATPKPWTNTIGGRLVTFQLDLYIFLTESHVLAQAQMLRDHDAIVVTERGLVLGWGFLWPAENLLLRDGAGFADKLCRVLSLAVAPEHRRGGVGSCIVTAARKIAGDVPIFGTGADATACRFFKRHDMLLPR